MNTALMLINGAGLVQISSGPFSSSEDHGVFITLVSHLSNWDD